jgi:tRNA threonylcarbamoyladenosine biosynthesis protein TsaB
MLFVSIDTSGKAGGISLAEGGEKAVRILESAPIAGGTFSAQLVPTLASVLRKHGFVPGDIGGFVAVSGPGAFTGLRVGLSALKGLAEVLKKPIATVSLLEALAVCSGKHGPVFAALDARREEVFAGLYEIAGERATKVHEELLSPVQFAESLKHPWHFVTCDSSIAEFFRSYHVEAQRVERPGSEAAARIGWRKLVAGDTVDVEALDGNYIRRSDAEIFSKPKPS